MDRGSLSLVQVAKEWPKGDRVKLFPDQISSRFALRDVRRLGLRPTLRFAPGSQAGGSLGVMPSNIRNRK